MFSRIQIENYRCFKQVDVPLRPLTVLVGGNNTGKSSFLEAIMLFERFSKTLEERDSWNCDTLNNVNLSIYSENNDSLEKYSLNTNWERRNNGFLEDLGDSRFVNEMKPFDRFSLPVQGVCMVSKGLSDGAGVPVLGSDGSGFPTLLDYLLRKDRRRLSQLIDAMKSFIPGLVDIDISTPDPSSRQLGLILENGLRLPADQASAGVRLILFFLALTFHPTPPKLILVEEPETGVHPKRLADIVGLLRDLTKGTHGLHPAQVILTTHSPYLLDSIDPNVDQVLVFRRESDGSRSVKPVDVEGTKEFLDDFMLGEVWFNVGEDGLVAKH